MSKQNGNRRAITRPYLVYVSHAPVDEEWVQGYLLPSLGIPPERVIVHGDFGLGEYTIEEINRAIEESEYTVLIFSEEYIQQVWAIHGSTMARSISVLSREPWRIIPLYSDDCNAPLDIKFRESVRLYRDEPDSWESELARLRKHMSLERPTVRELACPYPGMVPFETSEHFYGRGEDTRKLVVHVRDHDATVVIGPSGTGKSSLIRAGLEPKLGGWPVCHVRLGPQPEKALWRALAADDDGEPSERLSAALDRLRAGRANESRVLVIIDPLEDVFTQAEREARSGFWSLLELMVGDPDCAPVLTMRADFYGDFMASAGWKFLKGHKIEITGLSHDSLLEAILQPARSLGVYVESTLAERLANEAAEEPGVLPFLQETLRDLWNERMTKRLREYIPLALYPHHTSDKHSTLMRIMQEKANAALASMSDSERVLAWRILLRLVQFNDADRRYTRRQRRMVHLLDHEDEAKSITNVVKKLAARRLITMTGVEVDEDQSANAQSDYESAMRLRRVDLAHEALIRHWAEYQKLIDTRRSAEESRRYWQERADKWVAQERQGRLLSQEDYLDAASWRKDASAADVGCSSVLDEYMKTSAHALRRVRWISRAAVVLLLALTIASGALAAVAANARQDAELKTKKEAQAREREAQAREKETQAREKETQARKLAEGNLRLALTGLEELGRIALLEERYSAALDSLSKAYLFGGDSLRLRFLLARAMRFADSHTRIKDDFPIEDYAGNAAASRIATLSNGTVRLWDLEMGTPLATLWHEASPVQSFSMGSVMPRCATSAEDGSVRLWDIAHGELIVTLPAASGMAMNSTGSRMVTYGDGNAQLWDTRSGEVISDMKNNTTGVIADAEFSPSGRRVVLLSAKGVVTLWDGRQGTLIARLDGGIDETYFSPNGKVLATISQISDTPVVLWDPVTGRRLSGLALDYGDAVDTVQFSPDSSRLLIISDSPSATYWNTVTGKRISLTEGFFLINIPGIVFTADSRRLIMLDDAGGDIAVWNAQTGRLIRETYAGKYGAGAARPGGAQFVIRSQGYIHVFDAAAAKHKEFPYGGIGPVLYSVDGDFFVTTALNTAMVWDSSAPGKALAEIHFDNQETQEDEPLYFSLHADPGGLFFIQRAHELHVIRSPVRGAVGQERCKGRCAISLGGFTSDGPLVEISERNKAKRVMNPLTGKEGTADEVRHKMEIGNSDCFILREDYVDDESLENREMDLDHGKYYVRGLIPYDRRMNRIVAGDSGGRVIVWDVKHATRLAKYEHLRSIDCAAFLHADDIVVSYDGTSLDIWVLPGVDRVVMRHRAEHWGGIVISPDEKWMLRFYDLVRPESDKGKIGAAVEVWSINVEARSPEEIRTTLKQSGLIGRSNAELNLPP